MAKWDVCMKLVATCDGCGDTIEDECDALAAMEAELESKGWLSAEDSEDGSTLCPLCKPDDEDEDEDDDEEDGGD